MNNSPRTKKAIKEVFEELNSLTPEEFREILKNHKTTLDPELLNILAESIRHELDKSDNSRNHRCTQK